MSAWFRLDEACDGVHGRFLAALREHARDWPPSVDPLSSGAFLIDGMLTTYVDVADVSLRAEFDGSGVYANAAHDTVAGLGAAGSPDACAAEAAHWYLEQLRRVRC
jgi:hypothetical protein